MKILVFFLLIVALGTGGAFYYKAHAFATPTESFRMATVKRGELLSTISATGTVEPEEVVDVGAQVAGLILEFGPDPRTSTKLIDYGSVVEKGTLLANIDPTSYEAALEQGEATLQRSEADVLQLEAKYEQSEREWKRAESLRPMNAIADTDYDTTVANYKAAKANLAVGKATVRQSKASLRMAKVNLGYTKITSPVRGVILDRRVNVGQTVVASLNAPSLFLIAKDLGRMQVWASVNEADIGRIRVDMPVQFTVDAHPGETFRGKVTQIRMNAQMTQNVVTYTVVVTTDNSSGKLLPYLTANVQFEVEHRANVLLVPNSALRWKPQASQIATSESQSPPVLQPADSAKAEDRGCLWAAAGNGLLRPIEVTMGASDGTLTEISGAQAKEGMQIVVGEGDMEDMDNQEAGTANKTETTSNPFLPKPPKGSRPPPGPM
jgi:HlyD family secretion protein